MNLQAAKDESLDDLEYIRELMDNFEKKINSAATEKDLANIICKLSKKLTRQSRDVMLNITNFELDG